MVIALTQGSDKATAQSPEVLSTFDPVHIGVDEFGHPVSVSLPGRNMLIGGEPGSGKSTLLNLVVAHAALSLDCRLCLLDGKQVELGQWRKCADVFVGPDIALALLTLKRLQIVMDNRYRYLLALELRDISRGDPLRPIVVAIDEIAYFSATIGTRRRRSSSPICCGTWWRVAGRSASSSSPPRGAHRRTSSPHLCGICSRSGSPGGAPPTRPRTSCSGTAGRQRAGRPT